MISLIKTISAKEQNLFQKDRNSPSRRNNPPFMKHLSDVFLNNLDSDLTTQEVVLELVVVYPSNPKSQ